MNSDFWKQFEGAPRIDCVKMKHDIQAKIYEETKDMTWEERIAYFHRGSAQSHSESPATAVLREEPSAYGNKQP